MGAGPLIFKASRRIGSSASSTLGRYRRVHAERQRAGGENSPRTARPRASAKREQKAEVVAHLAVEDHVVIHERDKYDALGFPLRSRARRAARAERPASRQGIGDPHSVVIVPARTSLDCVRADVIHAQQVRKPRTAARVGAPFEHV